MNTKLSSKEMIVDITSMRSHARLLLKTKKPYEVLLKALIAKDYYYDEDLSMPTLKELSNQTGITYQKVRNQLFLIYQDLVLADDKIAPLEFKEVEYLLSIYGRKNSLVHPVKSLPLMPRVGDNITIPYFTAYLNTHTFYVESISHEMTDQKQITYIHLLPGYFSPYWHFRKSKALEVGEIALNDSVYLDDYELKRRLKIQPRFF